MLKIYFLKLFFRSSLNSNFKYSQECISKCFIVVFCVSTNGSANKNDKLIVAQYNIY